MVNGELAVVVGHKCNAQPAERLSHRDNISFFEASDPSYLPDYFIQA